MSEGQNDPLLQEITACETLLCEFQNSSDAATVMAQDLLSWLEEGKEVLAQLREVEKQKTEQTEELTAEVRKSQKILKPASKTTDLGLEDAVIRAFLNIFNFCREEDMLGVLGVDEKKATEIIEYRKQHPEPFQELEDLESFQVSTKLVKELWD